MFGRQAITTDLRTEQYVNDPFETNEDRAALFARGTSQDGTVRWSHSLLDADLFIQEAALPIESYRQSGWLAFS